MTNEMREEKGLPALQELDVLNQLSEQHSKDMAQRDFFDHVNPDGMDPFGRMQAYAPELLSAVSGENIAVQSLDDLNTQEMAQKLMTLWKESPEHYEHIIEPRFWHLGVGVTKTEDRIYATQTFSTSVVRMESTLAPEVKEGEYLSLRFQFLAPFPTKELSVFLHAPDPNARIPAGEGRVTYIGKGPLTPQWSDAQHFRVEIPVAYGLGTYRLLFGQNGTYYDAPYTFKAVKP